MKNFLVLNVVILFSWSSYSADPNWPLKLRPGNSTPLSSSNSSSYRLSGYCAVGQGDVTIAFGSLTLSTPCHDVLGVYKYIGDMSSETTTNPIQQCVTQSTSPLMCARSVDNEQAPPGLLFSQSPLLKITANNEQNYKVTGSCAPSGAAISVDIGTEINLLSGTCLFNNSFKITGDVSAVADGIDHLVAGNITAAGVTTTANSTVTKGVQVNISPAPAINSINETSYNFSGICTENGAEVTLDIGGISPSTQPICTSLVWSVNGIDLSTLPEGPITVTANHSDSLGNSALPYVLIITKDTSLPNLTGLSDDLNYAQTKTWNWGCDKTCTYRFTVDTSPTTVPTGAYSSTTTTDQNLGTDTYYLHIQAQDSSGNESLVAHVSALLDNTPPDFNGDLGVDKDVSTGSQSARLDWSYTSFSDSDSGLNEMEISVGTSSGSSNVVTWSTLTGGLSLNPKTYQIIDGTDGFSIALLSNTDYYTSLRITDEAGNSTVKTSTPWEVPISLSGLQVWLDATDYNNGTTAPISNSSLANISWKDKSGNTNDYISSNGAKRFITSGINDKPSVEITGTGYDAPVSARVNTSAVTIYAVGKKLSSDYNGRVLEAHSGNYLIGWWGTRSNSIYLAASPSDYASGTGVSFISPTKIKLIGMVRAASGSLQRRDETGLIELYPTSNTLNGRGIDIVNGAFVGTESSDVLFSEYLQWDRELSATEIAEVESYLKRKWFEPKGRAFEPPATETSCKEIKDLNPLSTDGTYDITVGPNKVSVYCDMTTDGGGWTLIGRGREGWSWSEEGYSQEAVSKNIGTLAAFIPAYYSSIMVDSILGKNVSSLIDGVWIKRAANPTGTVYQNIGWDFTSQVNWSWLMDTPGGMPLVSVDVDGTVYSAGGPNTRDYYAAGNGPTRIFTWPWGSHGYIKGFAFGSTVSTGSNNSTSFLWENGNENHAIPYTEVYVRD